MPKKVKDAVGEWLPIIEDAIPLNQMQPLDIVVYQAAGDGGAAIESP